MASELRVNKLTNRSGLGTVTYTDTGAIVTGIVTATSFSGDITGDITGGATGDFSIVDKIIHTGDTNTAIRFPAADQIQFETGGTNYLKLHNYSSVNFVETQADAHISLANNGSNIRGILIGDGNASSTGGLRLQAGGGSTGFGGGIVMYSHANSTNAGGVYIGKSAGSAGSIIFGNGGTSPSNEYIRIDSSGRLLINNTSADGDNKIQIYGTSDDMVQLRMKRTNAIGSNAIYGGLDIVDNNNADVASIRAHNEGGATAAYIAFKTYASGGSLGERLRIDSGGRLIVGHTASDPMFYTGRIQVQGTNSATSAITVKTNQNDSGGPAIVLGKSRGSVGTQTIVQSGDELGAIYWNGADGTDTNSYASAIRCNVDGTPGSNDMPGRLLFMTTADGASTSTERLRITSNGQIFIANEAGSIDTTARLGEGHRLQLSGLSSNDGISVVRYSTSYGPWGFNMGRSKSGTLGTNTIVQNHNDLGHITFWGADGTDFNQACQISGAVDGTPSDGTDMPGRLVFKTTPEGSGTPVERLRIDKNGDMCLGGTPFSQGTGNTFCIHSSGTGGGDHAYIYFTNGDSGHSASDGMSIGVAANQVANIAVREAWPFAISTNGSERMRFLTDGEIVMGTANSGSADTLYVTGPSNSGQSTVKILGNGNNGPQANTCALDVQQNCDGAPNTSPALKLTHTNTLAGTEGAIMSIYTNTNNGTAQTGWVYHTTGRIIHNRPSTDGTLFSFRHNSSSEGNIAISGSTVSYNGGHLSRWSQFVGLSTTSKAARPTIYQGTVLSNLDEMCEWTGEDNQQLNKTKVSDTVGDKDVAGVFWTWDEEDDETGYVNDFYVAMTGDMVIRVAGSTSVARGDLLESAGDGTAKPQSDDIVRSKTIAKIISTTSTATYADGSKAYPCVLMAC